MYTRLAAMTAAVLLTATAASATTLSTRSTTETAVECGQLMSLTEQTVKEQQDIGQKARNQVGDLMAKLRDHCAANQFEQADQTAALIRGLVVTE